MKKLFLLICFNFLFAKSLYIDFSACYKKYSNITNLIPISKTRSITFTPCKKYISYDPFTKIYVVWAKNKRYIKFYSNANLGWFLGALSKNNAYIGSYAKKMIFFTPAKLSVTSPKNTIISDIFCKAYGVGRGDGFIPYKYIQHFLDYGYWGDIGIEVDEKMRVKYIDPFYVKGIKIGDKILFINGKKATPFIFTKEILFAKKGDIVYIQTQKKEVSLKVRKKIYNFNPLMHFGIMVNKNLIVTKLPKKIQDSFFITPPAKLIAINNQKISTFDELKKILSLYKNVTITLQKEGININIPLRQ